MSHVTLRTITMKSKMKYGKYFDYSVKELLLIKNNFRYIVWSYYNLSNISFDKEVLDLVGIEHLIDKPGKDTEYYEKNKELLENTAMQRCFENGDTRNKYRVDKQKRVMKKDAEIIFIKSFESKYSNGALQRKNHGHK